MNIADVITILTLNALQYASYGFGLAIGILPIYFIMKNLFEQH